VVDMDAHLKSQTREETDQTGDGAPEVIDVFTRKSTAACDKTEDPMQERVLGFYGSSLIPEYISRVVSLENDVLSKSENIVALNKYINVLKAKNDKYVGELSRLSNTVEELVAHNNHENVEKMVEIEQDLTTKVDTIENMQEDIDTRQLALDGLATENTSLSRQHEMLQADNRSLEATVEGLTSKNNESLDEIQNLLNSFCEAVEQNVDVETKLAAVIKELEEQKQCMADSESLEATVEELTNKNTKLEDKSNEYVDELNRLADTIEKLVECNHKNIEKTAELEQDVAVEVDTVEKMQEDIDTRQLALDDLATENTSLTRQLVTHKAHNLSLKTTVEEFTKKNAELNDKNRKYVDKLNCLVDTVEELVVKNNKNDEKMDELEQDLTIQVGTIEKMQEDIDTRQLVLDDLATENKSLSRQIKFFEADNGFLKETIEDLTNKNTQSSEEIESLFKRNAVLETKLAAVIKEMDESKLCFTEEKDGVKQSLERLREQHKTTIDKCHSKLEAESEVIDNLRSELLTASQVTAANASLEAQVDELNKSLEESNATRSSDVGKLQEKMEDIKKAATKELELTKKVAQSEFNKSLEESNAARSSDVKILQEKMEDIKKAATKELELTKKLAQSELKSEMETKQKKLNEAKVVNDKLTTHANHLRKAVYTLSDKVNTQSDKAKIKETDNEKLMGDLDRLKKELASATKILDEANLSKVKSTSDVNHLTREVSTLSGTIATKEADNEKLVSHIDGLKKEITSEKKKSASLMKVLEVEKKKSNFTIGTLSAAIKDESKSNSQLKKKNGALREEKKKHISENEQMSEANSFMAEKLNELKEANNLMAEKLNRPDDKNGLDQLNAKDKALVTVHNEISQVKIIQNEMLSGVNVSLDCCLGRKDSEVYGEMQAKQLSTWEEIEEGLTSCLHGSEASLHAMTSQIRQLEMERESLNDCLPITPNTDNVAELTRMQISDHQDGPEMVREDNLHIGNKENCCRSPLSNHKSTLHQVTLSTKESLQARKPLSPRCRV